LEINQEKKEIAKNALKNIDEIIKTLEQERENKPATILGVTMKQKYVGMLVLLVKLIVGAIVMWLSFNIIMFIVELVQMDDPLGFIEQLFFGRAEGP
jgi:cytochrome b subunit of formate dehydrogenase